MRCSKSCYLYDLELVDLFEKTVIEQVLVPFGRFFAQFFCFHVYPHGALP